MSQSVMEQAFMLTIEFGRFGNSRKAPLSEVTVDADKTLLSLSKRLLKSDEYDAIVSHDREVKKWLETVAVAFPIRRGSYLIPITIVQDVDAGLNERKAKRAALVEAFLAVYPSKIQEIEADLRDMYNAADYPSVKDVRERFTLTWEFLDYGVPGRLRHLNMALYEAERQKMVQKIANATEVMQQALRESMLGMVEHMVDRLTPGADGKKKVFKESSIASFKEFLDNFKTRNLTNDDALDRLVGQAKALLDGVDASQVREQDGLRDALATGFAQIQAAMDGMVVARQRQIRFEPSPSAAQPEMDAVNADYFQRADDAAAESEVEMAEAE